MKKCFALKALERIISVKTGGYPKLEDAAVMGFIASQLEINYPEKDP
jgi:hypothetical protein